MIYFITVPFFVIKFYDILQQLTSSLLPPRISESMQNSQNICAEWNQNTYYHLNCECDVVVLINYHSRYV